MNKYNTTIKMLAVTTAALLLVPIVAQTPIPIATAQSTQDNDTALRVAKNKQYREEVTVAYEQVDQHLDKVAEYKKQKESAKSEQEKQDLEKKIQASLAEIDRLEKRIEELQQLNYKLYEVEPELKERLLSAEKILFDKYQNPDSSTYVGDNAVEFVGAYKLIRSILVHVDPDKAQAGAVIPTETSVDGIPVVIEYHESEPLSCEDDDNTKKCDPLIGGISIADKDEVPDLNTLGYKASRGSEGFVMAGHSANGENSIIVQPHDNENREVGKVEKHCLIHTDDECDFAFAEVENFSGIDINSQIWRGTGDCCYFNIVDATPRNQQEEGTFVRKVGAATQQTTGEIVLNSDNYNFIVVDIPNEGGDSGSPVFHGGTDAELYGMLYKTNRYYTWDYIEEKIGASPITM